MEVYEVPKEDRAPMVQNAAPATTPTVPAPVSWKLPNGWQEVPASQMRVGSFVVTGDSGARAEISIIPLGGISGSDIDNVNRWRSQMGMPPLTPGELPSQSQQVAIGGTTGLMVEAAGSPVADDGKRRLLGAILHRPDAVWFFKMMGEDALVLQQKAAFVEFLKSITFGAGSAPAMPPIDAAAGLPADHPPIGGGAAGAAGTAAGLPPDHPPVSPRAAASAVSGGAKPDWKVPAGWLEVAPGAMQTARFTVAAAAGGQAGVSVAVIPGTGGGALANVNRWRGQLGLAPVDAAGMADLTTKLEVANGQATVLDIVSENQARRMVAVSLEREGSTWFFKLVGDAAVVGDQKTALLQFAQSLK